MKTQITLAAALTTAALFAVAGSAQAQTYGFSPMFAPAPQQNDAVVIANGNYHAATAEESWARGHAEVVRAYGEAAVDYSIAANYWEMARAADIQNDYDYAQTFFAMRELNREARAAQAGPPVTRYEAERISAERMPERLSRDQYEPVVGQLYWPEALQEEQYAAMREQVDSLMYARWTGEPTGSEIADLAESMDQTLTSEVREISTQEYLSAKRFLTSLRYEMNFSAAPGGDLAAN